MKTRKLQIAIVAILCLSLSACGGTQVLVTIQAVLNGIAALQGALPLAGVPPEVAKEIGDYASAAATGVGQCATLLAAGGETVTIVAKCGAFLSAAIKPVLPPGTPMAIAALVQTVYAEIQAVYAAIETGAPKASVSGRAIATTWKPTGHQSSELMKLATKAGQLASVHK